MGLCQSSLSEEDVKCIWDWSDAERSLDPLSIGGDVTELLSNLSQNPPEDVASRYGLLESVLCLLGRNEFDADLPVTDPKENVRNAKHAASALTCLQSLANKSPAVIQWLANHRYAASDLVFYAARGISIDEAKDLLDKVHGSCAEGARAVSAALETEARARRVYDAKAEAEKSTAAFSFEQAAKITEGLRVKYSVVVPEDPSGGMSESAADFEAEVRRLTRAAMCTWQTMPWISFPGTFRARSREEQQKANSRMRSLQAKMTMLAPADCKTINRELTEIVMDVPKVFVSEMVSSGIFSESKRYSVMANTNHPDLLEQEEFQAGRNAWACFGIQMILLRGVPVECNSAVLGYSMLYPFSDNLLDCPNTDMAAKRRFQKAFRAWLVGGEIPPELQPRTETEQKVAFQVRLIEQCWPRDANPNVFHSLVAINDAQTRSLDLHCSPKEAKYEDALEVSCYKGGTSVLADLYVTAGNLPLRQEAAYAFHLGFALQIVDDLQDVDEDLAEGQQTLFTVPRALKGLFADSGAVRLAHMIHAVLDRPLLAGESERQKILQDGKRQMCYTMSLKAVMRAQPMFSKPFIDQCETFCPIPRAAMAKLAGMRTLMKLVKKDAI